MIVGLTTHQETNVPPTRLNSDRTQCHRRRQVLKLHYWQRGLGFIVMFSAGFAKSTSPFLPQRYDAFLPAEKGYVSGILKANGSVDLVTDWLVVPASAGIH